MTASIDIECPACASTAGNYGTSSTTDPTPSVAHATVMW